MMLQLQEGSSGNEDITDRVHGQDLDTLPRLYRRRDHTEIDGSRFERLHRLRSRRIRHLDLNVRILDVVLLQDRQQIELQGHIARTDAYLPLLHIAHLRNQMLPPFDLAERAVDMVIEDSALRRKLRSLTGAHKQRTGKLLFQKFYSLAHCRLGNTQFFSRRGKLLKPRDRAKDAIEFDIIDHRLYVYLCGKSEEFLMRLE